MHNQKSVDIYLVRHGESEGNIGAHYQHPNSPLNPLGREQARQLSVAVARFGVRRIIASNYPRALETAIIVGGALRLSVEQNGLFVEREKPSRLLNKRVDDASARPLYTKWVRSLFEEDDKAEDGESHDVIVARADRALEIIRSLQETTIIFSHGFFIRTLLMRMQAGERSSGQMLKHLYYGTAIDNCSITHVVYQPWHEFQKWRIQSLNVTTHLRAQ